MDIKIKQRIVGIAVLIALFVFCLFLLLQGGKKTQPHLPAINTEPPVSLPALSPEKTASAATSVPVNNVPSTQNSSTTPKEAYAKPVSIPAMPSAGIHATTPAPVKTVVNPEVNKTPEVNANLNSAASQTAPATVIPSSTASSTSSVSLTPSLLQKDKQEKPEKNKKQIKQEKQKKQKNQEKLTEQKAQKNQEKTGSYIVQVGAFSEASHVKALTDKLQKEGFVVDVKKIKTAKGELTSVSLGGKGIDHVRAEKFKARLEKEFQLKPVIKKIGED